MQFIPTHVFSFTVLSHIYGNSFDCFLYFSTQVKFLFVVPGNSQYMYNVLHILHTSEYTHCFDVHCMWKVFFVLQNCQHAVQCAELFVVELPARCTMWWSLSSWRTGRLWNPFWSGTRSLCVWLSTRGCSPPQGNNSHWIERKCYHCLQSFSLLHKCKLFCPILNWPTENVGKWGKNEIVTNISLYTVE